MVINQRIKDHFTDLLGSYSGTVQGTINDYLVSIGYSGSLNNMLQSYLYDLGYGKLLSGSFQPYLTDLGSSLHPNTVSKYDLTISLKDFFDNGAGTFTRASSRTGFDRVTGDLTTYGNNEPHFGELGLLIEESRTNQVTSTTPDSGEGWSNVGTTATLTEGQSVEACKGRSGTAGKCTVGDTSGGASFCGPAGFFSADSAIGCASFYVRGEGSSVGKTIDILIFDLTGTAVLGIDTFTLTDQPQRIHVVGSATTAGNVIVIGAGHIQAYGGASTLAEGDYFYIDVGQYETGAGPSSPILTSGAAATRAADLLSIPASALPAYTSDCTIAMTVVLKEDPIGGYHGLWAVNGETSREGIVDSSVQKTLHFMPSNSGAGDIELGHSVSIRYVCTYDADGNWVSYIDNALDNQGAVGAISGTATSIGIGANTGGSQVLHGWIRDVRTYDRALSSTEVPHA